MEKIFLQHDPGELRGVIDWVDERFGPILKLWGIPLLPPEPRWWVYGCDLARLPIGTWSSPEHFGAAGASIDPHQALQRALGEAVERYSGLCNAAPEDCLLIAPAENPIAGIFPLCAPDESCPPSFRESRLKTPITHVRMRHLSDDCAALVSAAHVYLGFSPQPPEPMVTLPISTGLAFHTHLSKAIWSGLCEVAERDAMMLMWWNRRPLRRIEMARRLPECITSRLERLRQVGLTAHLFDMSTDFRIPTVFCLVTGERYPYVIAGAACHADPVEACAKALDEGASARLVTSGDKWPRDIPSILTFGWVRQLEHHIMLYAQWRSSPAFEFLWRSKGAPLPFDEFAQGDWWPAPAGMDDLVALAAKLATQDLTVLWTEVTAPEVAELGHVVKVVVPQMVPLSQDHNVRWLATPRLLRAAGLHRADSSAFHRYPHPFA
jgi:ribosomal protein S12 methylthiotransferase accessory factor